MGHIRVGKTNMAILSGEEDLSLWTDEELERGQRRDKNGKWGGRPPKIVPAAVHRELAKRRLSQSYDLLRDSVHDAVALLQTVVVDTDADYRDRITAAKIILDRVMGKEPIQLNVAVKPLAPWEVAMEQMVAGLQNAIESGVVDADSWEDDDEPVERNPFMIEPNIGAEQ